MKGWARDEGVGLEMKGVGLEMKGWARDEGVGLEMKGWG